MTAPIRENLSGVDLRAEIDRLRKDRNAVILEPALGRLLPMPLMIGWSDIPIGLVQLGVVGIIALYDRRTLGAVHPATKAIAVIVIAVRVAIYLLALTPPVIALADRLVGG